MPSIVTNEKLQEALSLAVEDRGKGTQDLVSNSNIVFHVIKESDMWKTFSGPAIRHRVQYTQSGTYVRFSDADFLSTTRKELFADAEWEPVQAAVSVVITGREKLVNSGENQLEDIFAMKLDAAETEIVDRFTEDLHSAGALSDQLAGLQSAIPTTVTSGTYGGIDRATVTVWRTGSYDINSVFSGITQFSSTTAMSILRQVTIARSAGKRGPTHFIMSAEHFNALSDQMQGIQRINDESNLGKMGFANLKFYGAGKSIPCVLEGGIGTAMPANVTYAIDAKALEMRYHPEQNFSPIGGRQMPIDQFVYVQHLGFFGQLILKNPRHTAKIYDSNTSS